MMRQKVIRYAAAVGLLLLLCGCAGSDSGENDPEDVLQVEEYLREKYDRDFEVLWAVRDTSSDAGSLEADVESVQGTEFTYKDGYDDYGTVYFQKELHDDLLELCKTNAVFYNSFTVTDLWYPDGISCMMDGSDNLFELSRPERLEALLDAKGAGFYVNVVVQINDTHERTLENEFWEYFQRFPKFSQVHIYDEEGKMRYCASYSNREEAENSGYRRELEDWLRDLQKKKQ
jgi:hypothetical protein